MIAFINKYYYRYHYFQTLIINFRQLDESEINSVKKALPEIMGFSELNIDNRYIKVFQNILEKNSIFNISYFMKNIVQNCSEMVKYCLWNNVPVNCLKSFKESLTVDGYCCSFNYGYVHLHL